ncbi:helicase/secretion neighborhood CpaE-like protein [Streptomyces sp. LcepLS]|nr:helicase/secretion neighborhood CpaE-like protein [Streptomyces sp. LcepLS]
MPRGKPMASVSGTEVKEGRPPGPLVITEDPELLDDVLRLCAAAGVLPEVRHTAPERRGDWEASPLVLLGTDVLPRLAGVNRRPGLLVLSRVPVTGPGVWRHAVERGAEHVLVLPDAEEWLTDRLAEVAEVAEGGTAGPALTVGVIGGRGGAGASTLACALALSSAADNRKTLLVDADPWGGGIDVVLGAERQNGLRWPDFARSRGRVSGSALEESLPAAHGLRVLSWDRGETPGIPPEAVRAVLAAGRRRGGAVVVDLPRRCDAEVAEVLRQLDLVLLLVPKELRALASARKIAASLGAVTPDVRLLVSAPPVPVATALDTAEMVRLLGLPFVGEVPWEGGLVRAQATGQPPGSRGPLARFCQDFWDEAAPPQQGASRRGRGRKGVRGTHARSARRERPTPPGGPEAALPAPAGPRDSGAAHRTAEAWGFGSGTRVLDRRPVGAWPEGSRPPRLARPSCTTSGSRGTREYAADEQAALAYRAAVREAGARR